MGRTLRDKTTDTRRQHVLEAATRVFAERGFRGATIRDVAREAGVADGTIYNTFDNKAALLHGLLARLSGGVPRAAVPPAREPAAFLENLLTQRWADLTPEVLAMLRVVLAEALVDPDLRSEVLTQLISPPIAGAEPVIAGGIAQGSFAASDAPLTARALTALVVGLVMLRLLGEPEIEARADEVPATLARLLAEGLRPRVDAPSPEGTNAP